MCTNEMGELINDQPQLQICKVLRYWPKTEIILGLSSL